MGQLPNTCVVCDKATDSGVALQGSPMWMAGVMVQRFKARPIHAIGLLQSECCHRINDEQVAMVFRICKSCANDAGMTTGLVPLGKTFHGELPCYYEVIDGGEPTR